MPKYLIHGSYTTDGQKGLLQEGGTARRAHFNEVFTYLGGKVEAFYFAFGKDDIYSIVELPDNVSAAAISLAFGCGGGFQAGTIVLLTPEEIDRAVEKVESIGYCPPGLRR